MNIQRLFTTPGLRPILSSPAFSSAPKRANPSQLLTKCNNIRLQQQPRSIHIFSRPRIRISPIRSSRQRYNSNSTRPNPDPTPHLGSPPQSLSLSQRLKALSKEYGWTAVGVYFALSAIDFPFCFLAVQILGPERVGRWEHAIVDAVKSVLAIAFPSLRKSDEVRDAIGGADIQKEVKNGEKETASIWTQLALAYAVHKSLIFFRVPLTAAVLPSVVKKLRAWGYNVGRKKAVKTT